MITIFPKLSDPKALRAYREADSVLPDWFNLPWSEYLRFNQ